MSITPSTRNEEHQYTVVGGMPHQSARHNAVLILNRGPRLHRRDAIQKLIADKWDEIMWVEPHENAYSVESLAREFVGVRFLLIDSGRSVGEQINCAMNEFVSAHVCVLWSTVQATLPGQRVLDRSEDGADLCVVPVLRTERGEAIPSIVVPAMQRRALRVLNLPPRADGIETLFPADYIGLYNRKRFLSIGGFDVGLLSPFWQKMDFGFRAHLWDERIRLNTSFRATYRTLPEPEDQTTDVAYMRFFARNLALRFTDTGPYLPRHGAIGFALRSGVSISRAWTEFAAAREWVAANRESFRKEPKRLVREWEMEYEH